MSCRVMIASPAILNKWFDRWVRCYLSLSYPSELRTCVIATEDESLINHVKSSYDFIEVIKISRHPLSHIDRVYNIASAREAIREYFVNSQFDYLLMIDTDIEYPSDTVERMLNLIKMGYDLVLSREVGLIMIMNKDLAKSVHFFTGVCARDRRCYLEETQQIILQIEQYNWWRVNTLGEKPIFRYMTFKCKWARHKDNPMGVY